MQARKAGKGQAPGSLKMKADPAAGQAERILAIIPARNEEKTVCEVVQRTSSSLGLHVVVVDDQSEDGTRVQAAQAGATVLPLRLHLGAWGAIQTGFRYALRHGFHKAVTLDADGQHLPDMVPALLEAMRVEDYDVVIGSCPERASMMRKIAWQFFRSIAGFSLQDITSGFRVYNRRAMSVLLQPKASLLDYQDVGVLLLLREYGLKIGEVPVPMAQRKDGHSRVFATWFLVFEYMLKSSILCTSKGVISRTCSEARLLIP